MITCCSKFLKFFSIFCNLENCNSVVNSNSFQRIHIDGVVLIYNVILLTFSVLTSNINFFLILFYIVDPQFNHQMYNICANRRQSYCTDHRPYEVYPMGCGRLLSYYCCLPGYICQQGYFWDNRKQACVKCS